MAARRSAPPNVLSFSCGEAPRAGGRAAGRLRRLTAQPAEASASGMTPCVSEGKRGFSPARGKRPATSCDEKLGGYLRTCAKQIAMSGATLVPDIIDGLPQFE